MIYQNVELFNVAEVITPEDGGEGVQLLRCPPSVRACLNPAAQDAAACVTGCELRFVIEEGDSATLTLRNLGASNARLLVYYGSMQSGWKTLTQYSHDTPTDLTFQYPDLDRLEAFAKASEFPFSPRVIRVLLPSEAGKIAFLGVKAGKVRPPRPDEVPSRGCLLFYGSSITHGSLACTQNGLFAQKVARALKMDAQNQGYAGSNFIEPEVADWLSQKGDWTAMVAELGINIVDQVEPEEYRRRVRYFIETVHGANPKKYLAMIDMFYSGRDFDKKPFAAAYRKVMAEEVARVNSPFVVYVNGLSILNGPEFLSSDFVHPSIDGVCEIAKNLTPVLEKYLL